MKKAVSGKEDPVNWTAVASEVGFGLENKQCYIRWKYKLKPLELGVKHGDQWTADEVRMKNCRFSLHLHVMFYLYATF